MRSKTHSSLLHVMNSVVVLEHWKSENVEWSLACNDQEHTLGKIRVLTDVFDILTRANLDVILFEYEVQVREIAIAL